MYQYNFSKVEGLIMYGLGGYYYFDWTYIFVIIGIVISAIASSRVNSTFKRYSRTIAHQDLQVLKQQGESLMQTDFIILR